MILVWWFHVDDDTGESAVCRKFPLNFISDYVCFHNREIALYHHS